MSDEIIIEDYDPGWPEMFSRETALLRNILGGKCQFEHFGSTSVPDLAAKPVIDILAGIKEPLSDEAVEALRQTGYTLRRENAPWWMFFRKGSPRTHHLHIIDLSREEGRAHWLKELAFRNALRRSKALCRDYEELKRCLAGQFSKNRPSYEEGKTDFILKAVRDELDQ